MALFNLLYVTLFVTLVGVQGQQIQTVNGTIKITVGTTAGCGDTTRWLYDHLLSTYEKYSEFLELEFVPWGRTVWHEDDSFTCQFSTHNCWANRLHRCVLNMLEDQTEQLQYMLCEFASPSPSFNQGSYACADAAGLNLVQIDYCVNNPRDELDRQYEAKGTVMTQGLNFIPSLVINDDIDVNTHWAAFERLESIVCIALASNPSTGVTSCII